MCYTKSLMQKVESRKSALSRLQTAENCQPRLAIPNDTYEAWSLGEPSQKYEHIIIFNPEQRIFIIQTYNGTKSIGEIQNKLLAQIFSKVQIFYIKCGKWRWFLLVGLRFNWITLYWLMISVSGAKLTISIVDDIL